MILRILNPPHTGAQAEIGSEPLTIGSGMDCDLILSDPLLQPEHCKIRQTSDGIEVELTGGAAHLDGEPMEKSPFIVNVGKVLTIGSTHMAFGEADAVWSTIEIPELKTLGGVAPVNVDAEDEAAQSASGNAKLGSAPDTNSKRLKIVIAAVFVLVVLVLLTTYFYNADQNRDMEKQARARRNPADLFAVNMYKTNLDNKAASGVAEQIKREVSGATVIEGERTGRAFLRVYVRSRAQANDVQKIVNASSFPVFSEIVSLEEIEKSAEMMATMKGYALDVTFAKDGTAYWTGFMPKPEDWNEVKNSIEIDLPYIKENINNLTFAPAIEQRAKELLQEAGIKSQLDFKALPREIIITGSMPENQTELWSQVFVKLKNQFKDMLTITDRVGSGKAVVVTENPFHSAIAGVTLGTIPSVVLVDGQRIYIGTVLKDGSVLDAITDTKLTFKGPKGATSIPIQTSAILENSSSK
jgi:type III secretion system YscD/HrpQ family protein